MSFPDWWNRDHRRKEPWVLVATCWQSSAAWDEFAHMSAVVDVTFGQFQVVFLREHDWSRGPYLGRSSYIDENLQWGQDSGLFCPLLMEAPRELSCKVDADSPIIWLWTSIVSLHTHLLWCCASVFPEGGAERISLWVNKSTLVMKMVLIFHFTC